LAAVILTGLVATGAVLGFKHWQRTRNGQNTALVENRPAEDIRARVPPQTSPSDVELEIRTNGIHLGGVILTPKEAWRTVTKFLGTPTQTNRFHGDKLIYAFANHGVLLYSEPNAETDSVVVDFEGVGGINGTASPFRGKLSVEDQVINSDTAPRALLAMKQLGFKEPESPEEGFFAGQYHDLELVFAYQLKNPKKLSQLEISLK
jgi:hypothetical protein